MCRVWNQKAKFAEKILVKNTDCIFRLSSRDCTLPFQLDFFNLVPSGVLSVSESDCWCIEYGVWRCLIFFGWYCVTLKGASKNQATTSFNWVEIENPKWVSSMYIEKERGKGQLSQSASFLKASFKISLKWDMADFFYVFWWLNWASQNHRKI